LDQPETDGTDLEPSETGVTESEPPGEHGPKRPIEIEQQRTRRIDTPGPGGV
jgi:hypothetical protein